MADAAMSLAIDKLVHLLTHKVKLLKGVHKKVACIKDDLEIIRAFLKDADSKADKEGISEGVKAWVKQVREVAYCIEDVIDTYMVEACAAQHRDQQRGLMGSILYSICSLVSKLKPRHEMVSGIQDIIARLQEMKDRSERFRFISSEHVTSSCNATTVLLHDPREESLFIEEGKTTLAKKVYDNHKVKKHFGCQNIYYLIVFDNEWEIGFWGDVEHALFNNDNGIHVYQMEPLPQQEARELFCKKAFKFDFQGKCPKDLEALSHNIVRRCGGLRLAIVAVGGLLATKEKVVLEWKRLLDNLGSALVCDPHVENVTKILFLSYNDLPYHLKSCFLYFGIARRLSISKQVISNISRRAAPPSLKLAHIFQALPSLKSLGLFCGYDEEEVHFEGGFLKLKWLSLSGLNSIIIEKGALPLLQELAIGACPQQRQVPSAIQHLKNLKELSFAGMPDDSTQRLPCNGGERLLDGQECTMSPIRRDL
ncbi:putative disease resistance protein At1g50180 [Populus nigra]|uniref:putative disease resistance protein At1g50180 n=1 Tax=Populus nigra TaxID=3691 RepID=UPI002B270F26|nr:putative disease resistance protein At1g50180 [Populus nigra]